MKQSSLSSNKCACFTLILGGLRSSVPFCDFHEIAHALYKIICLKEALILEFGKGRGLVDTARIDQNKWRRPLVDLEQSAECQTLSFGEQEKGPPCAGKNVGMKKVGERTTLIFQTDRQKDARQTYFDEDQ